MDSVVQGLKELSVDTSESGTKQKLEGLDDVLASLRECIEWPVKYRDEGQVLGIHWCRGALIHGPSGVGKTASVMQVSEECVANVHLVTPATVIGQYMGESEKRLREVFEKAEEHAESTGKPNVILIEEADSLFPQRKSGTQQDARLVAQLLTLMDGAAAKANKDKNGHVVVIAITTHPNAIDTALRRPGRLDREIMISVPDMQARYALLKALTQKMNLGSSVNLQEISNKCHGYTGADMQSLCTAALIQKLQLDQDGSIEQKHFLEAMQNVGASVARSVSETFIPAQWDDVGGLEDVKSLLKQYCVWPITRSEEFVRLGIHFPKGVLLHGPPGCAKTTLARAAVTASGATFIPLLGTKLYSMYVGDGEAELRRAFTRARLSSPSVLFIDEIDSLVGSRGFEDSSGSVDVSTRLLTTFLTEIDGIESSSGVLILGTTNRPFAIDSALLRPGRFDIHILVPPPDFEGRRKAFQVHTKNVPLAEDVSVEILASKTGLYTGAEIQAVCREATMVALRQQDISGASYVTQEDFENALQAIKPAHTAEELDTYARWPSS